MAGSWTTIVIDLDWSLWGRRKKIYEIIKQIREESIKVGAANSEHYSFQIYTDDTSIASNFHISFRFLDLEEPKRFLVFLKSLGYKAHFSDYEENALWLQAAETGSKWVLQDLAGFPDLSTPDREYLQYLIHALMNNLLLSYQDEYDLYRRMYNWAQTKISPELKK